MRNYEAMSRAHFDQQAKDYDRNDTVYYSKYPKISCKDAARRLEAIPFRRLLDIGCGTGYLINLLLKDHPDADYTGLDLSSEMLREAGRVLGGRAKLQQGSALALPYESNSFDVVTCIQSFHHYPDPRRAMAEAYRVTAKGGRYLLSDTGCSGIGQWLDNHIVMRLMKSGDYRAYNRREMEELMTRAGFRIEASCQLTKFIHTLVGAKD